VADPEVTKPFLRGGLNPILSEFRCAAIIAHHTPKTTHRKTEEWNAIDWNYAVAGHADIPNWARAGLVVDGTKVGGVFRLDAGRRWERIGWADEDGKPARERLISHGTSIFWRDATEDEVQAAARTKRGRAKGTKEDLKVQV